jgi:hypothetical protein
MAFRIETPITEQFDPFRKTIVRDLTHSDFASKHPTIHRVAEVFSSRCPPLLLNGLLLIFAKGGAHALERACHNRVPEV